MLERPEGAEEHFTSPGYPANYAPNISCEWAISVPRAQLKLIFRDFDVESHVSCKYDSVMVRLYLKMVKYILIFYGFFLICFHNFQTLRSN